MADEGAAAMIVRKHLKRYLQRLDFHHLDASFAEKMLPDRVIYVDRNDVYLRAYSKTATRSSMIGHRPLVFQVVRYRTLEELEIAVIWLSLRPLEEVEAWL